MLCFPLSLWCENHTLVFISASVWVKFTTTRENWCVWPVPKQPKGVFWSFQLFTARQLGEALNGQVAPLTWQLQEQKRSMLISRRLLYDEGVKLPTIDGNLKNQEEIQLRRRSRNQERGRFGRRYRTFAFRSSLVVDKFIVQVRSATGNTMEPSALVNPSVWTQGYDQGRKSVSSL